MDGELRRQIENQGRKEKGLTAVKVDEHMRRAKRSEVSLVDVLGPHNSNHDNFSFDVH